MLDILNKRKKNQLGLIYFGSRNIYETKADSIQAKPNTSLEMEGTHPRSNPGVQEYLLGEFCSLS